MLGALPFPAARPWGGQLGPVGVRGVGAVGVGAVGVGVGTHHRPHSVRSCEPALRAVGVAGGRPRGGRLAPM